MKTTKATPANRFTFTAKNGAVYSFPDYTPFAVWYFSVYRRTLLAMFDAETFKKMNRLATSSKEARSPAL